MATRPTGDRLSALAKDLLPHLAKYNFGGDAGGGGGVGGSVTLEQHALDSATWHTGTLDDDQAPQFLMTNGTRSLTGNLAVSSGVTIDGVDLSAHVADPDAHHDEATAGDGIDLSGQQVSVDVTDLIDTAYGLTEDTNNIRVNLASPSGLEFATGALRLGTPATLTYATTDALSGASHSHAVTASADVSAGTESLLKSNSTGGLHLSNLQVDTNVLYVDAAYNNVGINKTPDGSTALWVESATTSDVTQRLRQITGQTARIWRVDNAAGQELIVLDSVGNLQSGNPGFVSGLLGWQITPTGNVEFNNGWFRGELHATVFVADEIHATGGTLFVATTGILKDDATIAGTTDTPDYQVKSATVTADLEFKSAGVTDTATLATIQNSINIKDPPSGHAQYFATGDILRCKTLAGVDAGTLDVYDIWMVVNSAYSQTDGDGVTYYQYYVDYVSGTATTLRAGSGVVSYGVEGDGRIMLTSDLNYAPYQDVFTTGAEPWTGAAGSVIPHVRLGRLDGVGVDGISGIEQYGLIAGTDLSDNDSPYIVASNLQLKLFKVDLESWDGANPTVRLDSQGSLRIGLDVDNAATTSFSHDAGTGDVLIGSLSADNYVQWDQSEGVLTVKGAITIVGGSITDFADAGALATLDSVDLATGQVTNKNLDNVSDGTTYKRVTANEKSGAGYAYSGLNSNGSVKSFVAPTTPVTTAGAGLYLGSGHMGYFNGSAWRTYIDSSGSFYFGGSSGATIAWDGTNLYGTNGTTTQWYASSADGKLYAGGGTIRLDSTGASVQASSGQWTTFFGTPADYDPVYGYSFRDGSGTMTGGLFSFAYTTPTPDEYALDLWLYKSGAQNTVRVGAGELVVGLYGSYLAGLEVMVESDGITSTTILAGRVAVVSGSNSVILDVPGAVGYGCNLTMTDSQVILSHALLVNSITGLSPLTSPASPLHVYEDTTATGTGAGLTIEQDGTGDAVAQWLLTGGTRWVAGIDNSDSDKWKLAANADVGGSPLLTVTTGGLVGIGTASPSYALHVQEDSSSYQYLQLENATAGTGAGAAMRVSANSATVEMGKYSSSTTAYKTVGTGDGYIYNGATRGNLTLLNDYASGAVTLTAGGASSAHVTVASDGKVGVGTGSPAVLLDVADDSIRVRTSYTPATSGASGNAGEIAWDANYIYVCTATNTWRRAAIGNWGS
jgi:hypothetical protein